MATGWNNSGILKVPGIPAPSGKYEVGCVHLMYNELFLRLYYPTDNGQSVNYRFAKHEYHSKYNKAALEFLEYKLAGVISSVVGALTDVKIPALLSAPLISQDDGDQFPVVVFSHGLGTSFFIYSAICIDIASNGYVVAAVEHKDQSACIALRRVPKNAATQEGQYDRYVNEWIPYLNRPREDVVLRNQQVKQRSQEVQQALDLLFAMNNGQEIHDMLGGNYDFLQFKGRLNTELAVVAGHSFGGGTTIQTLSEDKRFCCGIALDAWMFPLEDDIYTTGIEQPLQFINTYEFQWKENVAKIMKLLKPVNEAGIKTHCQYTIKGTKHTSQSDGPFVIPASFNRNIAETELNAFIAHEVNMKLMHAFLRRVLHKDPTYQDNVPLLDGGENSSEHVLLGTNIDLTEMSLEETPKEGPPLEEIPKEPPLEDTPQQEPPLEDTPKEEPPLEDTPKEESPLEDTPKEELPLEDTPKEEPLLEDTPKEEPPLSKEENSIEKT